ncbi:MAG: Cellulose biosynthesis protein BcsQ [Actinomycetota bacterium]|jgi:hypothetical protein
MIVGVASWRAVGATTTALALAQAFAVLGDRPWLIEADPSGGVLGARIDELSGHVGALERIAFGAIEPGRMLTESFRDAARTVAGVRVVAGSGDPFRSWACHQPRHDWVGHLEHLDGTVVVDLGTLRRSAPIRALLERLDLIVLIANPDAVSIVGVLDWIDSGGRVAPGEASSASTILPERVRIAVVDAPLVVERLPRLEIETELGERLAGWIGWSPLAVDHLHRGGALTDRRVQRDPLVPEVLALADRLRLKATAS